MTFVWIIGRITHGVLFLIREDSLGKTSWDIDKTFENTTTVVIIVLDFLITELLSFYFILDHSFLRIFKDNFLSVPVSSKLISDGISMNSNPDDDFTVQSSKSDKALHDYVETLSAEKSKLGILQLADINYNKIVLRKISLSRINKYVLEGLTAEVEEIKNIGIKEIVYYSSFNIQKTEIELVMPYFPIGSLFNLLHVKNHDFSLIKKIEIATKIAKTMKEIHKKNFFHGHLSSHNIMLDENYDPLIADLGLEHLKKYCGVVCGYCNKSSWSSPEVLADPSVVVTKPQWTDDIFSFGIILWELVFNQEPFPGYTLTKLRAMVVDEGYRPAILTCGINEIPELLKSCWNKEPSHRPEFQLVYKELLSIASILEYEIN